MASALTNHQCDICKKNQINKDANVWCFECNERLCADCLQIHRVQDILRDHKPIHIEDYQKLDPTVTSIKYKCDQHGMKYDFYCVDHDTPICRKCVSEGHRSCSDVKPLTEVTTNVKDSFLLKDLQERALNIQDIVQHIINEVSSIQGKVKDETSRVISIVKAAREAINQRLDLLQGEIIKEIRMRERNIEDNNSRTLTTLQCLLLGTKETLDNLSTAKRYASNFHTYCGIKLWDDETHQREAELTSLQKNLTYFKRFDIQVNQKLMDLQTEITEFAFIKSEHTKHEVKLLEKEMQEQKLISKPTDITLSDPRSFTLPTGIQPLLVLGSCVLESGTMIFTDSDNKRLIHVDDKGNHCKDTRLSFNSFDVVEVNDKTVAVTSNWDNKLVLVDIKQGREVRTVYKGEACFGLCFKREMFFVIVPDKKIKIISLEGHVLSSIDTVDDTDYCWAENGNIYYTGYYTDTVYCCDLDVAGKVIWKYTCNKDDGPHGITIDSKGNLLVTCRNVNNVICIDKTGTGSKVLLSEKDGMNIPGAITYNNMKHNTLLVANCNDGKCFLYKVN